MATPETPSVELDPLAPSFDGDLNVVPSEEHQIVAADTRELPAYSFDSDDKTLVGIGISGSAGSSTRRHFDSSDQTLVGIGPAERAKRARAQAAELASQAQQAEPVPESARTPHSEPPGPFVASDDDHAPDRLPTQKGEPWVLALSAMLVAAAAVALLRGDDPHSTTPRRHFASTVAPPPTANETRTADLQFETAAATSPEASAFEIPIMQAPEMQAPEAQAPEAPQPAASPATLQREKSLELARWRAATTSTGSEPLGTLDVTSNPPSGVVLDGRPLGKAPRAVQLPPGTHTVLFIHPERGRMSVTVNVRAGRTTSASADF